MSNLTLQGNASGVGTTTLQSANTANTATLTLPDPVSTDTLAALGLAQTFTAAQTFRLSSIQDGVVVSGRAGGTSTYAVTLTPTTLTASRTLTLPNASGTVATVGNAIAFSIVFGL